MCNKPLTPEDDSCNIQNIWAYWQDDNSSDVFKVEDGAYLDHALKCFRSVQETLLLVD